MPAVKIHTDELRSRLIDIAGRVLAQEGASALTLRRLATLSGTSTMAIYTLFGNKQGLLAAMYAEGFGRLGRRLTEAAEREGQDPLAALHALGLAYRESAHADAHLYRLMFDDAAPGFRPEAEGRSAADATFDALVQAVARCVEAGALVGAEPERVALHLWAVSHGMVSIELSAWRADVLRDAQEVYEAALLYAVAPFLPPQHARAGRGSSAQQR